MVEHPNLSCWGSGQTALSFGSKVKRCVPLKVAMVSSHHEGSVGPMARAVWQFARSVGVILDIVRGVVWFGECRY